MWVDDNGTCHSVALPRPTELMTAGFRNTFDQLLGNQPESVSDALAEEEGRFFEEQAVVEVSGSGEPDFEGVAPPMGLLDGTVEAIAELRACIQGVDRRWRLDALMALDDYVE